MHPYHPDYADGKRKGRDKILLTLVVLNAIVALGWAIIFLAGWSSFSATAIILLVGVHGGIAAEGGYVWWKHT
jgi:hypothetical protein